MDKRMLVQFEYGQAVKRKEEIPFKSFTQEYPDGTHSTDCIVEFDARLYGSNLKVVDSYYLTAFDD